MIQDFEKYKYKVSENTPHKESAGLMMPGKYTYKDIIKLLEEIPDDAAVSLMIRHSERELTDQDVVPFGTRLTPRGISMAEDFGRRLPENFTKTFRTSPVPRSQETLLNIARGASAISEKFEIRDFADFSGISEISDIRRSSGFPEFPLLEDSNILGKPGAYVIDRDIARKLFMENSTIGLTNRYLDEEILPGFRRLNEGTDNLMDFLTKDMTPGNISINVSHDATVAAFLGNLTGMRFSEDNWIPFIGGVAIVKEKNSRMTLYCNEGEIVLNK